MLMTRMFSLRPGNLRPQAADAADDQVDLHSGAGGFVEFFDDLLVDERVELGDDARRLAGSGVIAFAFDQADQAVFRSNGATSSFSKPG